jgi:hypothetical protein
MRRASAFARRAFPSSENRAFWGQRYAIVADPEGYMCDLFAPLRA